ncbi:MAG: acetamidase/formamidase family protein [Thermoleophilia bacterium]
MLDLDAPPAPWVAPGEPFWVETNDAHRGTITDASVVHASLEDTLARLGGANPVGGPIAIEGAEPGGCLRIHVEEIVPAPRRGAGYTCTTARVDERLVPETVICALRDGAVALPTARGELAVPFRPMIGTLGVAPAGEARPSFQQGVDVLGNVDLPELTTGATVVLPVHRPGGLLYVGDAHLAQGHAEIHRAAVEAEADVRLRVELVSREEAGYGALPQLDDAASLGCVSCGPAHLEDQVRAAYRDLAERLVQGFGLSLADAWRLLGAAGRVTVGQVVPPLASVRASIARSLLPAPHRRP